MFDASLSSNLSIRNHLPNFRRINHIALFWEGTIVTIDSKWFFYSLILDGLSSIFLPFFLTKPTVKPPFPLALEGSVPVRPWRTQAVVAALAVGMQRAATRQHAFAAQAWHCHTWNPRNPCVLRILKNKKKTQIYENLCNVYSRTWNMMIFTGRFGATQQLLGPPRAPFNCTSREILNITFKSLLEIRSSLVGCCFSKWTFTNPHC